MKRALILFLVASFVLWVLPLGDFIKPSLKNLACDGQRAICMCHALVVKSSDKAMEPGIALKAGTAPNKQSTSGGGSNYLVSAKPVIAGLPITSLFENQYFSYKSPYLAALEYVPKV